MRSFYTKNKYFCYNLICTVISFVCLTSMYVYPNIVKGSVKDALLLCTASLIPSLFPFITCSRILCEVICRLTRNKRGSKFRIFGFSDIGFTIHLLGIISGYPAGALLASNLYGNGIISKDEAEKIIAFSNCISPSFCIIVFGEEILGSHFYGVIIFLTVATSNFICMLLFNNDYSNKNKFCKEVTATLSKNSIASIIRDCSTVMVNICAFVIFFNCISALIISVVGNKVSLDSEAKSIISTMLEISSSISSFKNLSFGKKILFGSILMSFGGISAIMQVISICETYSFSYKTFIICKIMSATISPIITFLIIALTPIENINSKNFIQMILQTLFVIGIILLLTVVFLVKKCKKTRKNSC